MLEQTGLKIQSQRLLAALAAAGANVEDARQVARFPRRLIEGLVEERRQRVSAVPREAAEPESQYRVGLSGVIAPHFHDYPARNVRPASRADLLETIKWAEVYLSRERHVDLAVTMSELPPQVEPVEAYALLLQHTSRPGIAYTTDASQIPYLVEIAEVYHGRKVFPRGPDFLTSPLTVSARLAEHSLAALDFGQRHFAFGVMPISGGNAPITIAGNVVQSAAEWLGLCTAVRAIAPDSTFSFAACNGIVDMRKGTASFNAPEALLADLGVVELVDRRYGGDAHVAAGPDYIDAALPGMQAAFERTYRAMAIAAFAGEHFRLGGQGTLDAGQVFSPVQFILEQEMGEMLWRFGQGIEVSEETLAVDTIAQVRPDEGRSFLDCEHTLRHFRATWFPKLLYRGEYAGDAVEQARDQTMLDAAYDTYRGAVARYTQPELASETQREIARIVERARHALVV